MKFNINNINYYVDRKGMKSYTTPEISIEEIMNEIIIQNK